MKRVIPAAPSACQGVRELLLILCVLQTVAVDVVANATLPAEGGNLQVNCGRLIDGINDEVMENASVLIKAGRIVEVDSRRPMPAAIPVLDLPDHTCLPGLIDMHDHIADLPGDTADLSIYFRRTPAEQAEVAALNAEATLLAGFTSIRSVGAYLAWSELDIRDRVNAGKLRGPRIQGAGIYLTIPGGGGDLLLPDVREKDIPAALRLGVARGAEQFRERARLAVSHGADLLKVIASGAVLAYGGVPGAAEMTPEEIRAVVEVGHAAGIKVTAHAHGAESIKDAIRAGVDSIEHASLADDEAIALAVEHGVAFSMDVYNGDYIASVGREQDWPEEFLRKNDETTEAQRRVFSKAWRAGVTLVYGTDAAVYPHGLNARQFRIMVERGMPPMDAIRSATSVAARVMGWEDRVGALAVGRYGDLVALRKDPLEDISQLEHIDIVIKSGIVVTPE